MNKRKCLEYYLDSKIYDYESVQKSIDETKKEYETAIEVALGNTIQNIVTDNVESSKEN